MRSALQQVVTSHTHDCMQGMGAASALKTGACLRSADVAVEGWDCTSQGSIHRPCYGRIWGVEPGIGWLNGAQQQCCR